MREQMRMTLAGFAGLAIGSAGLMGASGWIGVGVDDVYALAGQGGQPKPVPENGGGAGGVKDPKQMEEVDPSTLPEPSMGMNFVEPEVFEAFKLVEAKAIGQAVTLLEKEINALAKTDRERKMNLQVGLAAVYFRGGKAFRGKINSQLTGALKDEGDTRVKHRALFLQQLIKETKDGDKDRTDGKAWLDVVGSTARSIEKIRDKQLADLKGSNTADKGIFDTLPGINKRATDVFLQLSEVREGTDAPSFASIATDHSRNLADAIENANQSVFREIIEDYRKAAAISDTSAMEAERKKLSKANDKIRELVRVHERFADRFPEFPKDPRATVKYGPEDLAGGGGPVRNPRPRGR